jgi:hypothetical protein
LGADFTKMLDDLKGLGNGGFKGYCENHNWSNKSCLWELPYTKALILPHNIDLMHQEHNVVESIINMCLDFTSFMKDNINTMKDLADLCDHASLDARANPRGNLSRPQPPYCLKLE